MANKATLKKKAQRERAKARDLAEKAERYAKVKEQQERLLDDPTIYVTSNLDFYPRVDLFNKMERSQLKEVLRIASVAKKVIEAHCDAVMVTATEEEEVLRGAVARAYDMNMFYGDPQLCEAVREKIDETRYSTLKILRDTLSHFSDESLTLYFSSLTFDI